MDHWNLTKKHLKGKLDAQTYKRWFENLRLNSLTDEHLKLEAPDAFSRDWILERHQLTLEEAASVVDGKKRRVEIIVSSDPPCLAPATEEKVALEEPAAGPIKKHLKLNPIYSFDNFVVGPGNRFAHAASLAIAESPAKHYNPFFIYGGVGLGKTHLMQAIGQHAYSCNQQCKITYTTSEIFTNELINSIQNRSTLKFRERYRSVDILMIDDIQFIAGKESTQEEFFHTFNTLYDSHCQIVISSDRLPKEIPGLEERLVSRFNWGLVTDIQAPDLETRIAILRKKAEAGNIQIDDDVTYFISDKVRTNIRELEGALIRVVAYSRMVNKEITLDLAKEVLKGIVKEEEARITVDNIKQKVANHFNVNIADIDGKSRSRTLVVPRMIAIYLSRELTSHSLPEIGGMFGGRDHTTILHSCKKIELELTTKPQTRAIVDELRGNIKP